MAESKPKRTLDDAAILSFFQSMLPYLYSNPENIDIRYEIGKWVRSFVEFDSFHTIMEESQNREGRGKVNMTYIQVGKNEGAKFDQVVSFRTYDSSHSSPFETDLKVSYDSARAHLIERWPDSKEIHYLQLRSNETPKIAVGFFRRGPGHPFTDNERELFARLEPHLLLVLRCFHTQNTQSQAFHYFDGFAKLASRLAQEHGLSDAEIRLIPDILFGYSNEEIAEREFISVPTVKSHVQHILKKTGTKSRHDLIGKFFTSPDHVRL